jgi:hypothetical protein
MLQARERLCTRVLLQADLPPPGVGGGLERLAETLAQIAG